VAITSGPTKVSGNDHSDLRDFLRVQGAATTGIDLGGNHGAILAGVGGVERRVLERVAHELFGGDAIVDLRHEVLASTVIEHVLAARVARGLGTVVDGGGGGGVDCWLAWEDCGSCHTGGDHDDREEAHLDEAED
jgi:hypothetical protein